MSKNTTKRDSLKGQFIGNYELLQTIGEGSFAKVKLAIHRITNQKVAIKIIDKTKLPDDYAIKNMYREAQIMRILDHPNIIKLFEVMETKKNLFFILEYAAQGEFLEYIIANGQVPEDQAKKYTKQIIEALNHMHAHNIVHRDLKAENFLLNEKCDIKLSGIEYFGLSNFFDNSKLLGTFCGSPVYSAPELIEGKKYIGPEVDAWSLGINVFAMVVGDLPFADSNLAALYDSIIKGRYNIPDVVSIECRDFISRLLVTNPKNRAKVSNLMTHSWLSGNTSFLDSMETKSDCFRPSKESEMDDKILDTLEGMGMDRHIVIDSVLAGKFNESAGLYFLISYAKLQGKDHELNLTPIIVEDTSSKESSKEKDPTSLSEELANILFSVERKRAVSGKVKKAGQDNNQVVSLPPIAGASPIEHFPLKSKPQAPVHLDELDPKKHTTAKGNAAASKGAPTATTGDKLSTFPADSRQGRDSLFTAEPRRVSVLPTDGRSRKESNATGSKKPINSIGAGAGAGAGAGGAPKSGLTHHSVNTKKLSIDETLYQVDETTNNPSGPRTIKYAFNCFSHSSMSPEQFFEKLNVILDKHDVQWINDNYLCACEWGDIKFEVEVCKLPRQDACGIRFKRTVGDIWEYKKLSNLLLAEIQNV